MRVGSKIQRKCLHGFVCVNNFPVRVAIFLYEIIIKDNVVCLLLVI